MIQIPLKNGGVATVDEMDADQAAFTWTRTKRGYAVRSGSGKVLRLHKIIADRMGIVGEADHENRNGLDNRRLNLRPCTRSQNNANRGKRRAVTTSRFKGVYLRHGHRWAAQLDCESKRYRLGCYDTQEEAARAYNRKAEEMFGEFAQLNSI